MNVNQLCTTQNIRAAKMYTAVTGALTLGVSEGLYFSKKELSQNVIYIYLGIFIGSCIMYCMLSRHNCSNQVTHTVTV